VTRLLGLGQHQAAALEPWCANAGPNLLRRAADSGGSRMNFAASVGCWLWWGYATDACYATNRQEIHLSEAKRCSDQAGHLYQKITTET
jgi:hypothetical protein